MEAQKNKNLFLDGHKNNYAMQELELKLSIEGRSPPRLDVK